MDRARISDIAERWMIPTSKTAYMAGLEKKPVIASARGIRVIDIEGKEYLDFGSGQMARRSGTTIRAMSPRWSAVCARSATRRKPSSMSTGSNCTSASGRS
jgi:4-aminobutyrate aminotransferase-like enzyme